MIRDAKESFSAWARGRPGYRHPRRARNDQGDAEPARKWAGDAAIARRRATPSREPGGEARWLWRTGAARSGGRNPGRDRLGGRLRDLLPRAARRLYIHAVARGQASLAESVERRGA